MTDIRYIRCEDEAYPARLREIADAPKALYVLGELPEERLPSVAVIGARDCSEYGRYMAEQLGAFFGKNRVQVVSGMARGIDGIAQEAALDAGGNSYAVLGSGVDVCYPACNRRLYEKLKAGGGILSEYAPGTPALPGNFPPRNRIVSALADAVIVVEAREKSGTLITVDMALEQGREVYVVPGRFTDALSVGCNRLVKLGAGILLDMDEFLQELREIHSRVRLAREDDIRAAEEGEAQSRKALRRERRKSAAPRQAVAENAGVSVGCGLSPECEAVWRRLDFTPQSQEELREKLPKKYQGLQISVLLMQLCMEGAAVQVSPGRFCRGRDLGTG